MIDPASAMTFERRKRLAAVLFPALLTPAQVFLFGPHTIYTTNAGEFNAPFWGVAVFCLIPLIGIAAVLIAPGFVLPDRAFPVYVTSLFGLGLLLWLQGNILVADYGLIDAAAINWSEQAWRTPYEIVLWVGLPVLLIAFSRKVVEVAPLASQLFLLLQGLLLVFTPAQPGSGARWRIPAAIFGFSEQRNVIHLVLDSFQSEIFREIVEANRTAFNRTFSGFVFFPNHAGAFPTTRLSIPAMLTGETYRNDRPIADFVRDQYGRQSIFSGVADRGYEVDVAGIMNYSSLVPRITNHYVIPRPYVSYGEYRRFTAVQLIDLSLFRHAPHKLKSGIYRGEKWLLQRLLWGGQSATGERRYHASNAKAFLDDLMPKLTVSRKKPLYKFIHLGMPHYPTVLDGNCSFIGVVSSNRKTWRGQAECTLKMVSLFLDRLRALGIYDNSLIVLSSDHGNILGPRGFPNMRTPAGRLASIAGTALALLVIKPPGNTAPLRFSDAPTAITDIPATVLDLLGLPRETFPGQSVFRLDATTPRSRSYAYYHWQHEYWKRQHFETLHIFSIEGNVLDSGAWKFRETIAAPGGFKKE